MNKEPLNHDEIKKRLLDPDRDTDTCPCCGEEDTIMWDTPDFDDSRTLTQKGECSDCGFSFSEVYAFKGYSYLMEDEKKKYTETIVPLEEEEEGE